MTTFDESTFAVSDNRPGAGAYIDERSGKPSGKPGGERIRHDNKPRLLQVVKVAAVTPRLLRITFGGDELHGFTSGAYDDHMKVFFPEPGQDKPALPIPGAPRGAAFPAGTVRPAARDYTPRRYDPVANELDIEFVLHGDGPASTWAAQAQPGQWLGINGPGGSSVVNDSFDWYLLAGDETALPAIARRLEELPAGTRAIVVVEIGIASERQSFESRGQIDVHWIERTVEAGTGAALVQAVEALALPGGIGYAWVASESGIARSVRQHLLDERGFARERIKAAGYWRRGEAGAHETHIE